jgi:hypothetical protein
MYNRTDNRHRHRVNKSIVINFYFFHGWHAFLSWDDLSSEFLSKIKHLAPGVLAKSQRKTQPHALPHKQQSPVGDGQLSQMRCVWRHVPGDEEP